MGDYCCINCSYPFFTETFEYCDMCMRINPNKSFVGLSKKQADQLLIRVCDAVLRVCKMLDFQSKFGDLSVKRLTEEERKKGNHYFYLMIKKPNGFNFSVAFNSQKQLGKAIPTNRLMYFIDFVDINGYVDEGRVETVLDIFKAFSDFVKNN